MFVDFSRTYREHTVETHRAATMKRPARRSPTPSAPAPLCLWRLARPEDHVCWHEAHHLRALFIDAAPAAAPPAQAALTAQAALAVSPPPSLRVLIKDPVAASPGSETEEEELVDGRYTINGIRATPPRLLFRLHSHAATQAAGGQTNSPRSAALRGGGAVAATARAWRFTGGRISSPPSPPRTARPSTPRSLQARRALRPSS